MKQTIDTTRFTDRDFDVPYRQNLACFCRAIESCLRQFGALGQILTDQDGSISIETNLKIRSHNSMEVRDG